MYDLEYTFIVDALTNVRDDNEREQYADSDSEAELLLDNDSDQHPEHASSDESADEDSFDIGTLKWDDGKDEFFLKYIFLATFVVFSSTPQG